MVLGVTQPCSEGRVVDKLAGAASWEHIVPNIVVVGILAGEKRRSGRAAERVRHKRARELGAFVDDLLLDIWGKSVANQKVKRSVLKIVSHDYDYVRPADGHICSIGGGQPHRLRVLTCEHGHYQRRCSH